MPALRRARFVRMLAACLVAACDRADAPPARETTASATTAPDTAGSPTAPTPNVLGAVLVVPGDTMGVGIVIFPPAPTAELVQSAPVTLLSPSGDSAIAGALLVVSDSQVCGEAPMVRLQDSLAGAWSVGILSATVTSIRMDSIESLSRSDSSRLVAELARLASSVPMQDTSRFKGLPFAVLTARGFAMDGRRTVVSHLVRRVPHEASPAEEHTLIIGERDVSVPTAPLDLVFYQRSEGTEETAENFEVLAAVRGRETVWLVIARDNMARTTYEVLERVRPGAWRSRWSRVLSC